MNDDDTQPHGIHRRGFLKRQLAAASLGLASPALFAQAEPYPSKPIKLLVGSPPGSTYDTITRVAAVEAEKQLHQPIIIENKSGAGGTPSFLAAKYAAPDGYTLVILSLSTIRQPILEEVGYDALKDFTYIASLAEIGFCVVVPVDSPLKTWADLLNYGRANPNKVSYGAPSGYGNSAHIFVEEVSAREKVQWTPVPFRASNDCMTALLGGQLTFSVDTLISVAPQEKAGKVRILAMATDTRQRKWPSIPTMRELGYSVSIDSPMGIGGPAGMDPAIVARLQDAFKFATEQASYIEMLDRSAQRPRYMSSTQFTQFAIKAQREQRELLTKYGLARKT